MNSLASKTFPLRGKQIEIPPDEQGFFYCHNDLELLVHYRCNYFEHFILGKKNLNTEVELVAEEYLIILGQTSLMLRSKVWLTQTQPLQYLKPSAKTKCPYPSQEKMFKAFWRQPPFCNAALPKSWHQIFCCPKLTHATHFKVCLCILADFFLKKTQ